ncbi:hypothetical protein BDV26DRAFT_292939 [Aspergillus bertholletiae]|uniref:Uncharacterized protein n=1 Tax=Aspergillus bertholletiae TaxID=1226010 RepID=A0A5N7B7I7_9EURO|nr:hypothetical protein BDV26DRAFT_292939 [Aspergillus bertholletiae]
MKLEQLAIFGLVGLAVSVPLSADNGRSNLVSGASLSRKDGLIDISARATVPGFTGKKTNLIFRHETTASDTKHGKSGEGGEGGGKGRGGESGRKGKGGGQGEGESGAEDEEEDEGDDEEGEDDQDEEGSDNVGAKEGDKSEHRGQGGQHGQGGHRGHPGATPSARLSAHK